jgi:peptidyl-prolyl cis-trans isomerase
MLVVALAATLSFSAFAAKKTKKNNKKVAQPVMVKPVSPTDFSYAAGVAQSASLAQFLAQRSGVDSAHIKDFVEGLNKEVSADEAAKLRALLASIDIKKQMPQIVQSMNQQATGKGDTTYVDATTFLKGLTEGLLKSNTLSADSATKIEQQQYDYYTQQLKTRNADFLKNYAKQKGVKSTPSGLLYKVIKEGDGAMPADTSEVEVHYEGKLIDGSVFDSSYKRGETATFAVNQVIKGWSEAVKLMKVGAEYEVCLPYEIAYGERGTRGIPPYSTLIFKIELKSIK